MIKFSSHENISRVKKFEFILRRMIMERYVICPKCHNMWVEEDYRGRFICHICGCEFTADGRIIHSDDI